MQLGDTLETLADRLNMPNIKQQELYNLNCLTSYTIVPGQTIYLPLIPPTSTPTITPIPPTPSLTPTKTGTVTPTPRAPELSKITPTSGINVEKVIINVQGKYLQPDQAGFLVELRGNGQSYELELGNRNSSSAFEATVPKNLPAGKYDLVVFNPDNQFDTLESAYESIAATPTVTPTP